MKRILTILALIVLFVPSVGWGATYYADPAGAGTTCSEGSPCTLEYAIETKAGANDTIIMAAGNYGPFDVIIIVDNGLTITGPGESTTNVSFNAAENGFYFVSNDVTLSGLTITTGGDGTHRALYLDGNTGAIINNVTIDGWGGMPINARNNATATFNYFTLKNCITTTETHINLHASTTVWNYCRFLNSGNVGAGNNGVFRLIDSSATATLNNPIFIGNNSGSGANAVITLQDGTLTINNPIIAYNNLLTAGQYVMRRTAGTLTINNPLLLGSIIRPEYITTGTITINNALSSYGPIFANNGKGEGYVTFIAVDSNHLTDGSGPGGVGTSAEHYQTVFDTYGIKYTYFPDDCDTLSAAQKTVLQAVALAGHDVGCEGRSSSDLNNLIPFTVAYSGAGANPRVVITYTSATATTLELITDNGTDVSTTIGKGQTNPYVGNNVATANTVVKAVNDHADWAVTLTDANSFDDTYAYCLTAGTHAVAGDTDITLDSTKYYNEEITLSKSNIETAVRAYGGTLASYNVVSYVYSRYSYNATAEAQIKTDGYSGAISGDTATQDLSSITSIYNINNAIMPWAYCSAGNTEATIKRNAAAFAGFIHHGRWVTIVLSENAGATTEQLGWFISELQRLNIPIKSVKEMADYFAAGNGYSASGDGYTKTLAYSEDFHLQSQSPCIDAGYNLGSTYQDDYDDWNQNLDGLWDIGAYSFKKAGGE